MSHEVLRELFDLYIKSTDENSIVENQTISFCHLTNSVVRGLNISESKVYVTSRMVKHLFDHKPAEEFHFIIDFLHKVVKYPDKIFQNKSGKRGGFCFVKKIKNNNYLCSIEIVQNEGLFVATAFRLRKQSYLDNYKLMWSWKGDNPSS